MKRFDVAIVGAGPAGCSSAIFLAHRGYSVALLDKALFPREKLCGDFLNPANWEIFDRLGIRDALLSLQHEKVESFLISTQSASATVAFPSRNGRSFFGLGLKRSLFDDLLLRLAERDGVTVRQGCKPNELSRDEAGWVLTCGDSSAENNFRAKVLIGADGRNSWVAHRLGLAAPDESSGRFVAFQTHLRDCRGIDSDVQIHLFPGGYAGLVGLGEGMANLCFTVEKKLAREATAIDIFFRKYLYQNNRLKYAIETAEPVGEVRSMYPVYFSPRRCYGDGFLLVGDAARVTEPVTGEGIYFALKSGELAAAAADLALKRGVISARQLSSYHWACRRTLARRQRINRLVRAAIHRPYLLTPLVGLSRNSNFPVSALVERVCQTAC
jgi:geranylgeranyl reductase family protein